MAQLLFRVSAVRQAHDRGVVLVADQVPRKLPARVRVGDHFEIRTTGAVLRTLVTGIEIPEPFDPDRNAAFVVEGNLLTQNVPVGSEVRLAVDQRGK